MIFIYTFIVSHKKKIIWLICALLLIISIDFHVVFAESVTHDLDQQHISRVDPDVLQDKIDTVRNIVDKLPEYKLEFNIPKQDATLIIEPLFSSQKGSWPFEPFVHDGLFRIITNYQTSHPRAIVIKKGAITIEQLHQQLNNKKIIQKYRDGYSLHYPLFIDPDGALIIKDTSLYLDTFSGTVLINHGTLDVNNSSIQSNNDNEQISSERQYRPFIISWAGSRLWIRHSDIKKLGYNGNLTKGITSFRHEKQELSPRKTEIFIKNSTFNDLFSGVELDYSVGIIENNRFSNIEEYGIDIKNCIFLIKNNRIEKVNNRSGIRIRGESSSILEDNRIFHARKSGIEVNDLKGTLSVRGNVIGAIVGNGINLIDISFDQITQLLIEKNILGNIHGTAIEANNVHSAYIIKNNVFNTPEYAVSIRNASFSQSEWIVTGNSFGAIGKIILRVIGVEKFIIGNNEYKGSPILQNLLTGDLTAIQGKILDDTVRLSYIVQIESSGKRSIKGH
jgi:hypothetical protein